MTNGYDNTFILLSSVLSRINMIIGFVPGCVQSKLEEACVDITSVLRKKGFEVKLSDTTNDWHLDTFKIYTILNNIYTINPTNNDEMILIIINFLFFIIILL